MWMYLFRTADCFRYMCTSMPPRPDHLLSNSDKDLLTPETESYVALYRNWKADGPVGSAWMRT